MKTLYVHSHIRKIFLLLVWIFIAFPLTTLATHIVGGSLTYVHNGGSSYTVTLKLYRDCSPGSAGFPNSVNIEVEGYNGASFSPSKDIYMSLSSVTPVPSNLDPCAQAPNPLPCVEEGTYTTTVNNLPPNAGGYHMYYQIVARNLTILNVDATCNCIGETFYTYIPGTDTYWAEDFSLTNGTTTDNGTTGWTATDGATAPFSSGVNNNLYEIRGRNNASTTIATQVIDISTYTSGVTLSVSLSEIGSLENSDNISVYYSLDGGPQTLFPTNGSISNDFGSAQASTGTLTGSTVQIFVVVQYGSNSPNNEFYRIDDIIVNGTTSIDNSDPEFTYTPPLFLCAGEPFSLDNSAIDLDGDSLVYSFYTPYDGDNGNGPLDPTYSNNIPTFTPVIWQPGYSATNPLGGAGLNIDPNTGMITGTPPILGQFVVGVIVEEYRNGVKIGETLRDFQVNVVNCPDPQIPNAGPDITINDGCQGSITAEVFDEPTVTWNSIYPGAIGDYNNFLSCTSGCLNPDVFAVGTPPPYIDFEICGTAATCSGAYVCDTVRVTFNPTLGASILPTTPVICFGQTSTTLTAYGNGGTPPYSYLWNNVNPSQTNIVGAGTYTVEVSDSSGCPPTYATVTVIAYTQPVAANAGIDDTVCNQNPITTLNGTITGASGGRWSGGNGTFSPNDSTLSNVAYQPTAAEVANGFVDLILTSTGNGGCPGDSDTIRINYLGFTGTPSITPTDVSCYGYTDGSATVSVSGGVSPYSYQWDVTPLNSTSTISNIGVGQYIVSITDGIGCVSADTTIISQPQLLGVLTNSSDVTCNGGNDGAITSSANGGTTPYSYSWSSGGSSANESNLVSGNYTLTITDANGCLIQGTDTINEPPLASVSITSSDVNCFGGNDGTADATISNPQGVYSYAWSPSGGSSASASGLIAGTYTVTATSNLGCVISNSVTINQPAAPLSSTTDSTDVSCFGGSDGTATVTISGGTSSYTYSWSPGGQTTPTATSLSAGAYSYSVSDANGCTISGFVTVNEPNQLIVYTSEVPINCFGGSDGEAMATVSGGNAPYSYLWSPGGETTSSLSNLSTGTYDVTVTDNTGCTATSSILVSEPTAPLSATLSSSPTSCFGGNDGAITSNVTGGTTPYSYFWLPNGETATSINGPAGNYDLQITDNNGCILNQSATISEPTQVTIAITSSDVNCFNGSDGSITASASGGTASYSYAWPHSGETTANVSGLNAGTYTVNVLDNNGCPASQDVTISEPTFALSQTTASTPTSCFGGSDGTASVTPSGGTAPYSYAWATGESTASISGYPAGTYNVTITDANGCTSATSVTINEPSDILITVDAINNVSCFGGADGNVSTTVSGGTPNYSYTWTPAGGNSSSASGLTPGNYTLSVTDNNGCIQSQLVTVAQPMPIAATYNITDVSCFGGSDGQVSVNTTGGTAPFSYNWMPINLSGVSVTGLSQGTYDLTITDANGCLFNDNVSVSQPNQIVIATGSVSSDCGQANGTSFAEVTSGGTGSFSYNWTPGNIANDTAYNLISGAYTITVTDANGCTASSVSNVNDIAAPTVTLSKTDVTCNGGTDGTVSATLSGGVTPYSYQWSTGDNTASVTNLPAGIYYFTGGGSNGCFSSDTITITEPTAITASINTTGVLCNGDNNGTATITPYGGTPGYNFAWSGSSATTNSATDLVGGAQSVSISDSRGCSLVTNFSIAEPAILTTSLSGNDVSCFGGSDGFAIASTSGGTSPYSYVWTGGVNGASINNIPIGNYVLDITDANGCNITDNITISEPLQLTVTPSSANSTCGDNNGQASVIANGGTGTYNYLWSPSGGTNATENGLISGTYTITVVDANACVESTTIVVNDTPGPTTAISASANISCNGLTDGTATVNVTGGTGAINYLWSNGETTATASNLPTGISSVTVTDANGCISSSNTPLITQPNPLLLNVQTADVSCFGGNDGTASASAFGGTTGYNYTWMPSGNTGNNITNLSAGLDSVLVTDGNGCQTTTTFMINEPNALSIDSIVVMDVNCFGGNDGNASAYVSGGTPSYFYNWTPSGGTAPIETGLAIGTYTLNVTDVNGCTTSQIANINQPTQPLTASSSVTNASCFANNNGQATVTPNGGTPGYTYFWQETAGTNSSETGLAAGNYHINVNDANGCQTNVVITVTQPSELIGSLGVRSPSCGLNNGFTFAQVSGGTFPYFYSWSPSASTNDSITNLSPGTYSVTVTDDMGCILTLDTTLSDIPGPVVAIASSANALCYGTATGTATASITGGSTPFSISWSPFGGNGLSATGLSAGTYTAIVTDSLGCIDSASTTIIEPLQLVHGFPNVTDVSCNGGSNGAISLSPVGGSPGYYYTWSNGASGNTANNLVAGTYDVTITDSHGCQDSTSIVINEPTALSTVIDSIHSLTCYTSSDGLVSVNVTGGTLPYSYQWNNGQIGSVASQLLSGNQVVTVTDSLGCVIIDSATVIQPPQVVTTAGVDQDICYGAAAVISASATGGVGGYTFTWQPTGDINTGIYNVNPTESTDYTVVGYDANGCPGNIDSLNVYVIHLVEDDITAMVSVPSICLGQESSVWVQTTSQDSLTFTWNNGLGTGAGPFTVSPTTPTDYIVQAQNSCGVTVEDTVSIEFNPDPIIDFTILADSVCFPESIEFINNSSTGNPADQLHYYNWDFGDGQTSGVINPIHEYDTPGVYDVTLTVATGNGCTADNSSNPLTVTIFPTPVAGFNVNSNDLELPMDHLICTNTTVDATQYFWDFGDGNTSTLTDPNYLYTTIGTFTVELIATNDVGCADTAYEEINTAADVIFPNAFTPEAGSDGYYDTDDLENNVFFPYTSGVTEYQLQIFNRWGELIFESDDLYYGWNGTYRGELVQQGVYVWKAHVRLNNGKVVDAIGDVTVLR